MGPKNEEPQNATGQDRATTLPLGEQPRAVRRQEVMVILGNIGLLSTGMALGLPTVILTQLKDRAQIVHFVESQTTWIASINILSCPIGGFLSGYLLDKIGRKNTLYVLNLIALIAWCLMAAARQNNANSVFIQLLISRFLIGISMGLSSAPCGVYSAEISVPKIRGRLILGTMISMALGITLIYMMGYFIRDDYHLIAMICCGIQIFGLFCIMPMPETPNWLISKKRYEEAKKSLNFFRGMHKNAELTPEVLAEYNAIEKSIKIDENGKKESFFRLLRLPEVYKPLIIMISFFFFQQMSGIFIVIVYAAQIANEATSCSMLKNSTATTTPKAKTIDPLLCAVLIGVFRVLMTIPMGVILEKLGRRLSALVSAIGMCFCMLLLTLICWVPLLQRVDYLPVITIITYIVVSTIGLYTLPFFMISEVFPQNVRGGASGLTVAFGMLMAFAFIKTYPHMKHIFGSNAYCFLFFSLAALAAAVFVYFVLPETRGRTLLEIEEEFRNPKKKSTVVGAEA